MIKTNRFAVLVIIGFTTFFTSCNTPEEEYIPLPTIQSPVVVDLTQVPYQKLSDYKFFSGNLKDLSPSYGVIPYKPTCELFTDYAEKKRFIWLPKGTKANYDGDGKVINMPIGSALIKNFYYNKVQPNNTTRIIETRVMILKNDGWIFAEYVWNNEQTEAYLETQSSQTAISWLDENNNLKSINYKIPSSVTDCKRCHQLINGTKLPIGIKPQNLNSTFNYLDGAKNQLQKLVQFGYLNNTLPSTIVSVVNYKDTSKSLNLRVRSYFDINCAHCHDDGGEADHFSLRLAFEDTSIASNMGVGVQAEHVLPGYNGRIVFPGNVGQSILHYRVNTETDNFYMMPALGRTIRNEEAVLLIEDWINSL